MSPPIPIVICDDSTLARKQMSRALAHWNVEITHAEHGLEALEAVRAGKGHLLFLDLNMPIMDGYQTLERIRQQDLQTLVVVVSGDIQPDARRRVQALGALGFINKPIDAEGLRRFLADYGLADELEHRSAPQPDPLEALIGPLFNLKDYYQELANVAMGQAAALLSQLLGVFVQLPVPQVRLIDGADIAALLQQAQTESHAGSLLCQGFNGPAISGEALLTFNRHSLEDAARLMQYQGELTPAVQRELTMDIANVLINAFLNGLGQQLDISFSQSTPVILGTHYQLPENGTHYPEQQSLSIEVEYRLEACNISCNLFLLFTEDSIPALNERTRYL